MEGLVWPAKFKILPGYIFRQSSPAVFGVEVIAGKLKPKVPIMTLEGKSLGDIKTIESEGEKLEELNIGDKAALSVQGLTIGRQAKENDDLLVDISEDNFRSLKAKKELLAQAEINILKEIAEIHRKDKEMWGL
jgi:translation initiation factor 5B